MRCGRCGGSAPSGAPCPCAWFAGESPLLMATPLVMYDQTYLRTVTYWLITDLEER